MKPATFLVNIENPAMSLNQLSAIKSAARPTWIFNLLHSGVFLMMMGLGLIGEVVKTEIDIYAFCAFVSMIVFVCITLYRIFSNITVNRLKIIEGDSCIELSEILQSNKAEAVQRYAGEVQAMGRQYCVAEFFAMKKYAEKPATHAVVESAKAVLYS